MRDGGDTDYLRQELERTREELRELTLAHKKVTRALDLAQKQIERNKVAAVAKDNLARVISAKRSELERYMNLLLGNCPDVILLFDQDGRIAYCTDSFLRLCRIAGFGLIRGQTCEELLGPYTSPQFQARMREVFSCVYAQKKAIGFSDSVDFSGEGDERSYNIQVTPMLGEDGTAEGAMIILSDTTEIIRAQREAEQANAAKSDFLATVSHEIRTPMNAIIGMAGMLKSTGLDKNQQDYLRNIQESSHVLLNLINDILDFSKMEAHKLDMLPEYFRLADMLKHLQSMFELMFQQKGLDFRCQFAPDLPQVVYGDDKRVSQILTNILNNALKYTKEGGVCFSVSKRADGQIEFAVQDSGIGIREEAIPKLFAAFERMDLSRNKGIIGTGLGLAITKSLTDLLGGGIEVESVYGQGSCFTVTLPLREGRPEDLPPEETTELFAFTAPGARVLLVDDIEINLQIASYMLELFEIQIDRADSGKQAVDLAGRNRYDIIFMDHMMPEMDGVEAATRIRAQNNHNAVMPIVALTANAVNSAVQMFYANGFNDVLPKPMDETALAKCLLTWLPQEKIISAPPD